MNERLTNRNGHFEILLPLPIGRCDIHHGSGDAAAGLDEEHERGCRSNPGQLRQTVLSPQAQRSKEDARSSALAEKDLTFYVNRFL